MRFLIDSREAFHKKKTGKGQWARGFIEELATRDKHVTLLVTEDQEVHVPNVGVKNFAGGLGWHTHAAELARKHGKDTVYVSPTSYIVPSLLKNSVKVIPVVHDLIAFHREPHDKKAKFIERLLLRRAVKNAAAVCTVSEATKHDLMHKYSFLTDKKVHTIFAGPMQKNPPKNVSNKRIILCIGTLSPRKNQLRLIQAYNELPENLRTQYELVLVGARGWQDSEILRLAEESPGVSYESYASDAHYNELLNTSAIFAFPSLYEGFGMAVLDAMQRGIPVLTSEKGSLAEVTGEAALHVNPESTESITQGLESLLLDTALQQKLREKGPIQAAQFSWKKTVDLFLEAVNSLV